MRHAHHHMMHLEIIALLCNLLVHVTATLASTIDIFVPNQIISFSCLITNIMDHAFMVIEIPPIFHTAQAKKVTFCPEQFVWHPYHWINFLASL